MLAHEIRPAQPTTDDAPLIVLMHGRGASRSDLVPLGEYLPKNATLVFPEAPFAAAQWGYGAGSAWYRFLGRNRPEPESFSQSLEALHDFIARFGAHRIVLGGFSQGGTMGIAYALAYPASVVGVLNFSGFVADHPRVVVDRQNAAKTRFFWGHGRHDTAIPYDLAVEGRAQLKAAGADLTAYDYAIGHWIDPQELTDAMRWLAEVL